MLAGDKTQYTVRMPVMVGCGQTHIISPGLGNFTKDSSSLVHLQTIGQARRGNRQGAVEVWARPLWDGTCAVALFNRGVMGLVPPSHGTHVLAINALMLLALAIIYPPKKFSGRLHQVQPPGTALGY